MDAETRKEVIVKYPIDVVYDTLILIFPVKYYKILECDHVSHSFLVIDSFNSGFEMEIDLDKNTSDTTLIHFYTNYPAALMDLTHGGQQAIDTILEKLLYQLDKEPERGCDKLISDDVEVVSKDNFVNSTKNDKHIITIVVGYLLCFSSIVMPLTALFNYNPHDEFMAILFIVGIVALSFEISVSVILQYYENSVPVLHGRIQLCLCGLSLILLGLFIHSGLSVAGILIPLTVLGFFFYRGKSLD